MLLYLVAIMVDNFSESVVSWTKISILATRVQIRESASCSAFCVSSFSAQIRSLSLEDFMYWIVFYAVRPSATSNLDIRSSTKNFKLTHHMPSMKKESTAIL